MHFGDSTGTVLIALYISERCAYYKHGTVGENLLLRSSICDIIQYIECRPAAVSSFRWSLSFYAPVFWVVCKSSLLLMRTSGRSSEAQRCWPCSQWSSCNKLIYIHKLFSHIFLPLFPPWRPLKAACTTMHYCPLQALFVSYIWFPSPVPYIPSIQMFFWEMPHFIP